MKKNRLNKKKKDEAFATIGEIETVERKEKVKEKIEKEIEEIPIYFDKRQHSCKFPKKLMETISYKKGDLLKFILLKEPLKEKVEVRVEYVRR